MPENITPQEQERKKARLKIYKEIQQENKKIIKKEEKKEASKNILTPKKSLLENIGKALSHLLTTREVRLGH